MSTGLDCYFQEKEPGEWFLFLEEDYGSKTDPEYDKFGPFPTFVKALVYLNDNFANPGGWSVLAHPDSTDYAEFLAAEDAERAAEDARWLAEAQRKKT